MDVVFTAVTPVFIIIFLGMLAERTSLVPVDFGRVMSLFVINISMPCLIFLIMAQVSIEQLSQWQWWLAILFAQVSMMALVFFAYKILRRASTGPAMIAGLGASFANVGFVGLPTIMNLTNNNQEAMAISGLCLITTNAVVIIGQVTLDIWSRKRHQRQAKDKPTLPLHKRLWKGFEILFLNNPVCMATVLGLAFAGFEVALPAPVSKALSLLGYTAPPCMLFTLGYGLRAKLITACSIRNSQRRRSEFFQQGIIIVLKLIAFPFFTFACLVFAGCEGLWVAVSVILMATGSAIVVSVFAEIYRAGAAQAALFVAVSNMLSLFSISIAIWLMVKLGYLLL